LAATEDPIPIGQFAAASRLSLKALRLYDENDRPHMEIAWPIS